MGLDQGDKCSLNWATTTPSPAPVSHTWGDTSAGKLHSLSSVCSQGLANNYSRGYFTVILSSTPHKFLLLRTHRNKILARIFFVTVQHLQLTGRLLLTNENKLSGCRNKGESILAWFGLEGALKIIQFQHSCHGRDTFPVDQGVQSPIQCVLERFQRWSIHSFSGLPVPVLHHPKTIVFLSTVMSKPILFWFKDIPPYPRTTCPCKNALCIV